MLTQKQKKQVFKMQVFSLFLVFLQPVSMLSIIPFSKAVMLDESIKSDAFYKIVSGYFTFTPNQYVLFTAFVFIVMMFLSGIFQIINERLYLRTTTKINLKIQDNLVNYYLHKPYSYYVSINTSDITSKILFSCGTYTQGILLPLLRSIGNVFMSVLFLIMFFYINIYLSALCILCIVLVYIFFIKYFNSKSESINYNLQVSNYIRLSLFNQCFDGIKIVKLDHLMSEFRSRIYENSKNMDFTGLTVNLLKFIPKQVLIFMVYFIGICSVFILYIFTDGNISSAATTTIFIVGGLRLINVVHDLYGSYITIKSSKYNYLKVKEDIKKSISYLEDEHKYLDNNEILPINKGIKLENVSFAYPSSKVDVLKNINLEIPKNSTVGFVGRSGSGKTTTADVLLGLLEPRQGHLLIDDVSINKSNIMQWQRAVSYVPQSIFLLDDTIEKNIMFGSHEYDKKRIEVTIGKAQLSELVDSLEDGIQTVVGEKGIRLSGGQRQRLGIARALYKDTPFIIFDEATSSLDNLTENLIIKSMLEIKNKKTVVIIAHRISTVKDCDKIFFMDDGQIIDIGTFDELEKNNKQFRAMILSNNN